jgi:hypothetical protein
VLARRRVRWEHDGDDAKIAPVLAKLEQYCQPSRNVLRVLLPNETPEGDEFLFFLPSILSPTIAKNLLQRTIPAAHIL